jgi:CRP-like cAMP-binding protein
MDLAESPLDRALTLALAGDNDAALRWSAALVKSEPSNPVALLVTARLLGAFGPSDTAIEALETSIARAIDAGNVPLAIAASIELASLGIDPSGKLDEIADSFGKGSPRLLAKGAAPPELPGKAPHEISPLAAALSGHALLAQAAQIVAEARELLELDQGERSDPPKLAPHALFSALDAAGLRAMIGIFDVITVASDAVLIEQGTGGAEAYIVARGELEVRRRKGDSDATVLLARLGRGALFGEMALLSRAPRAASVIAVRPSVILVARRDALEAVAEMEPQVGAVFAEHCRRRMVENLVLTSSILSAVKPHERPALVERFVTRTYEEGERVITQDQESEGLHLIASGEVLVVHMGDDGQTLIAKLGAGDVVGEIALVLRRPSTADVIAACPTVTLHLPRDRFLDLIQRHPALLARLYETAVKRDEETSTMVAQRATEASGYVLI